MNDRLTPTVAAAVVHAFVTEAQNPRSSFAAAGREAAREAIASAPKGHVETGHGTNRPQSTK